MSNSNYLLIFIIILCFFGKQSIAQNLQPINPVAYLPDGTEFKAWENTTVYSKTYYVDTNASNASDSNSGTVTAPFKTINKAAQVVQAGERVLVKKGVYREMIRPINSGASATNAILYEAEPGAIIRGSETTSTGDWVSQGGGVWMLDLSLVNFPSNYNPFLLDNLTQGQIYGTNGFSAGMPWVHSVDNMAIWSVSRGMAFQNLKRLEKASSLSVVKSKEGVHWTDRANEKLYVHTYDKMDPNYQLMEVTTRYSGFRPMYRRMEYIHVKGFTIEQVANGFPLDQIGALSAFGGSHFLFENNVIREVNGVGIDIGRSGYAVIEETFVSDATSNDWSENIARGNWVENIGISGIVALPLRRGLIEKNTVINGTMYGDAARIWEMAGIKTHLAWDAVVRQNIIVKSEFAGLWVDLDNRNSRFTQNVIIDVNGSTARGIFNEKTNNSQQTLLDNNIIWDATEGYYEHEGAGHLIYNNAIGKVDTAFRINGEIQPANTNSLVFTLKNNLVYKAKTWYDFTGGVTTVRDSNAGSNEGVSFEVDKENMILNLTFDSNLSTYATTAFGRSFYNIIRDNTPGPIKPNSVTGTHIYPLNHWAKWYTDNNPPTVQFDGIINGEKFDIGSNIALNAIASDSDGYIKSVSLYLDNQFIRTVYKGNYSWGGNTKLKNMSAGTYLLRLEAEDDKGQISTEETTFIVEDRTWRIRNLKAASL